MPKLITVLSHIDMPHRMFAVLTLEEAKVAFRTNSDIVLFCINEAQGTVARCYNYMGAYAFYTGPGKR